MTDMSSIVSVISASQIFAEYLAIFSVSGSKEIFDIFRGFSNFYVINRL